VYWKYLEIYWLSKFGGGLPVTVTHGRLLLRLSGLMTEPESRDTAEYFRPLSRKTHNNILIPLRDLVELICRSNTSLANPTESIDNLKAQ